jgi:hypothetical protein
VTKNDVPSFDTRGDLLESVDTVGAFSVYRVRNPTSYFAAGSGRVVEQRLDSIRVADGSGSPIVLRFHYMETLRCRPDCAIYRVAIDRDVVGFIGIRNPPAAFEIYNDYALTP